jgi:hypothetical protein
MSLKLFARAMAWSGTEMEIDEVECILATMIYRGYIKGYMSHEKQALVLSRGNPFPAIRTIRADS